MSEAKPQLLQCEALQVGHAGRALLPPIEMTLPAGELVSVVGRNGSGKTTWMRTMLGLTPAVSGRVRACRADLRLSYIPQRGGVDELYPLLARDVVALGSERDWSFLRQRRDDRRVTLDALARVDGSELANRPFRSLSEGQKQRVLLARLVRSGAHLAFLDEPTSAMDAVAEREVFELLDELRRHRDMAVVVVSHYLGVARRFADRVLLFDRDTPAVVLGSRDEVLQHAAFQQQYGGADGQDD